MMKMMDELAFVDVLEDVMMKMMMMMMMTMMDELAVVDVLEGVAFVLCCIGSLYHAPIISSASSSLYLQTNSFYCKLVKFKRLNSVKYWETLMGVGLKLGC